MTADGSLGLPALFEMSSSRPGGKAGCSRRWPRQGNAYPKTFHHRPAEWPAAIPAVRPSIRLAVIGATPVLIRYRSRALSCPLGRR